MSRAVLTVLWLTAALAGCASPPVSGPPEAVGVAAGPVPHGQAGHDHARDHGPAGAAPAAVRPAATGAASFRQAVVPVLRRHCASCHTAGGAGATAITMFDAAGEPRYQAIRNKLGRMLIEIQAGRMPQGNPGSLPKDDFDVLDRWGASAMPDN